MRRGINRKVEDIPCALSSSCNRYIVDRGYLTTFCRIAVQNRVSNVVEQQGEPHIIELLVRLVRDLAVVLVSQAASFRQYV